MLLKKLTTLFIVFSLSLAGFGKSKTSSRTSEANYKIAFASFAPLNTDLFMADADGSNPKPLLAHPALDYNASFSRDGKWIVFTSERNGSADIYRVHPNGSGLARLTDDPAFDDQGALSPDGKLLAFVSSRSGQADIWVLELATKKLRNITNHPAGDFRPAWSPDGQWLAFSSDRDSTKPKGGGGFEVAHSTEIYLMRPDGSVEKIGGSSEFYSLFEVEHPLIKEAGLKWVMFYDVGNTFFGIPGFSSGQDFNLKQNWGFGLRWFSPLGPLRFEWGFPIHPSVVATTNRVEESPVFIFFIGQPF